MPIRSAAVNGQWLSAGSFFAFGAPLCHLGWLHFEAKAPPGLGNDDASGILRCEKSFIVLGAGGVLGGSGETWVSEPRNNILGTSGERGDGVSQSVGPDGMNHEGGPEGMNNEGAPDSFQGLDGRVAAVSFHGFGGGVWLPLLGGSND